MEKITIRPETEKDYRETETITRESFWDVYKPGCDEHLVLHNLRTSLSFVKDLDFVACDNEKVIGNIVYSKAEVIDEENIKSEILCMGPLCVLPDYQKKGLGSLLIKETMQKAKDLGFRGIVLFGNPDYYHRFGFKNAKEYNIQTSDGGNFEEFMAVELYENSLKGIHGKFFESKVFQTDKDELELFEKNFPYKEKHVTDTQLKF